MREVKRVAPSSGNPLVELCGRRCTAGTGKQHTTYPLLFVERPGHGEEFWPGTRRLEMVLRELLSIIVGDLHVRAEGQEIPHPTIDSYGHKGGVDGLFRLALLRAEWSYQGRIDQLLETHIILRKEVNLHASGLLHRPQALHQRFWWHVDSADAAVAGRFKPRQHLVSDHVPFRLSQTHRDSHCRLGSCACHC